MKPIILFALFILNLDQIAQNILTMHTNYYCPTCTIDYQQPGNCPQCGLKIQENLPEDSKDSSKKFTVCFYLQNGVEVLDFAGPMEVFELAGFQVFTVSKDKSPILSQRVLKVIPDYDITNVPDADMVVFFGGNPGAFRDPDLIDWVREYASDAEFLFTVCSGAFALGHAGLLNGETATTFHARIEELRKAFPQVTVLADVRFVDNGRIITSAGISAGIDGALHMVSRIRGEAAAAEVAREMEYDKWIPNEGFIRRKERNRPSKP